jgi:hypothetical protein
MSSLSLPLLVETVERCIEIQPRAGVADFSGD